MIYSRLVTQTDVFTILTVKWNLKQTQRSRLLLIRNVPLCMKNTMEPIQPVTLSLELVLLRKTKLKSKQNKKSVCFPWKKKKITKAFTRQWLRYRYAGEINNDCRKRCGFFDTYYKSHDMTFLRTAFYCYLCINFWGLFILMLGARSPLYTTKW